MGSEISVFLQHNCHTQDKFTNALYLSALRASASGRDYLDCPQRSAMAGGESQAEVKGHQQRLLRVQ